MQHSGKAGNNLETVMEVAVELVIAVVCGSACVLLGVTVGVSVGVLCLQSYKKFVWVSLTI